MQAQPLVSVIIPVYNCEKYLEAAIESILAQTYQMLEIIVVDDGSTDRSAEITRSFTAVKYFKISHGGATKALNYGIARCRGDYIAFLDADDLWVEEKLSKQIATFKANPKLEAIFGYIHQFKSPELDQATKDKIAIPAEMAPGYHKDTILIKTKALYRVGLYDENVVFSDFIDWYLRASEKGLKSLMLKEVVAKRRIHKTNLGIRQRDNRQEYARVLKASLDRRRKLGQIKSSRLK